MLKELKNFMDKEAKETKKTISQQVQNIKKETNIIKRIKQKSSG